MEKCKECGQPKRPSPPKGPALPVAFEWRCGTSEEFLLRLRRNINIRGTGA